MAWIVCKFTMGGGDLARKRGVVFLREGVDTPMHMYVPRKHVAIDFLIFLGGIIRDQ